MRLLLDTHVAIWALAESARLPASVADLVADPANDVFVSIASVWEIAIKRALGKRSAPPLSARDAVGRFGEVGFVLLPISAEHAAAVETLPPLHGDPFDRILVAQALAEMLRIVTHDAQVAAYDGSSIHW